MSSARIDLGREGNVEVEVSAASPGAGVVVSQKFTASDGKTSTTVTCTCTSNGHTYSTTKDCPNGNNTCDCSTPSSPKITCG